MSDARQPARRPIAARDAAWVRHLAARLAASPVTPDQISLLSVAFAALGAWAILHGGAAGWAAAAVCVQLRLLCNLLDGLVAVEGGKGSPVGALYNEFPDRVADTLFLVPLGIAAGIPWLGWAAALAACLTAYVRVAGGALGLPQDFGGVMAKQRRMALLTAMLLLQIVEDALWGTRHALAAAAGLIAVGGVVTCWTRTRGIARTLAAGPAPTPPPMQRPMQPPETER